MSDKPNYIKPVRGHKPPFKLRDTLKPIFGHSQDPRALQAKIQARLDELTEQPKPKIKERLMGAILNQLLAFLRTWLFGRPVYKTTTDADGVIMFVLKENGDKIMNIPLTILGRVLQLLGAFGLLSVSVFGKSIGDWVPLFEDLFRLLGGL